MKDRSQAIGEFLDYSPYKLCEWREPTAPRWIDGETGEPVGIGDSNAIAIENPDWFPEGYYPVPHSIDELLARWFGIDRDALEREKREMLAAMREANA